MQEKEKSLKGLEKEKVEKLTAEEKGLLVSMVSRETTEGPLPTEENIRFFTEAHVKTCIRKAYGDLNSEGKAVADRITRKLSL